MKRLRTKSEESEQFREGLEVGDGRDGPPERTAVKAQVLLFILLWGSRREAVGREAEATERSEESER